jgi:O-antigen/teichoic acid export membrane protein
VERNGLVLGTASGAAAVQLVLLVLLVPRFGATGAAFAYAVSMCGMYGVFWWIALREVVRLQAEHDGESRNDLGPSR